MIATSVFRRRKTQQLDEGAEMVQLYDWSRRQLTFGQVQMRLTTRYTVALNFRSNENRGEI
jgi:hypothetical protein